MSLSQIIWILVVLATVGFFAYTASKIMKVFFAAKGVNRFDNIGERLSTTLLVAFGQSKILRKPVAGILHALVWWGFLVITIGTVELIIDGFLGEAGHARAFGFMGPVYDVITASGEIFAFIIIVSGIIMLIRRYVVQPKRFTAPEMKPSSKMDATVILFLIETLMVSLILMNLGYIGGNETYDGAFPISQALLPLFSGMSPETLYMIGLVNWWIHGVLVLVFLNILPYSKHFHVIMAVPNVFFARLTPYAQLNNMEAITKEIKLMMDPNADPYAAPPVDENAGPPEKFGVKDVNDVTWKNIMDSYTCTECGRCTEVCPANNTGKKLSPRKLYIDLRARTTEAGPNFIAGLLNEQNGNGNHGPDLAKTLVGEDYISEEELWACTTCMACVQECPVDIDHVPFIVDMRRNLVLEESKVPSELAGMFSNIENNGAPWQYSQQDRLKWAEDMEVPTMAEMQAKGEAPEVLFWVGCSGSYDDRAQAITKSFARILNEAGVKYAVLGTEESCTGDPAKRAGNEFLFQMQAVQNIEVLNMYNVKRIVTACPHCYNTIKNEYPDLGGDYEVMHHSSFLNDLIKQGKVKVKGDSELAGTKVTYHDSCYIGRGNGIYEAPREVIENLKVDIREMKRNKSKGMCCGAGGAQMFKEEEDGKQRVNELRAEHAEETGAEVIAAACPFCMTMMNDGVKAKGSNIKIYDIAELIDQGIS